MVDEKIVQGVNLDKLRKEQNESSALDLLLSDKGWELKSTIKPIGANETVEDLAGKYAIKKLNNLINGETLEKGKIYLVKLQEFLNLKKNFNIHAQSTGKSSIGRLDVLTRLIINGSPVYDEVPATYKGPLYIEIIPLSFPIIIKSGNSLNQIRFFRGEPYHSRIDPKLLAEFGQTTPIILDNYGKSKAKDLNKLSINLQPIKIGNEKGSAFVAKDIKDVEPIDLSKKGYDPKKYFDLITADKDSLLMARNSFYILRSKERFYLPDDIAVRGIAYTESLGETRIHYAGFAHPGFARETNKGAPLIFEVRCHNFEALARDGEDFARIEFYKMAELTSVKNSDYDTQELKLSKYFNNWY